MVGLQLVAAVGEQQQRADIVQPAPEVAHEVERRGVGPVHVLDDQHGARFGIAQVAEQRREQAVPRAAFVQRRRHRRRKAVGQVDQRAERPRRVQVFAAGDERRRGGRVERAHERLHQRGLADARFAVHEHARAVRAVPDTVEDFVQARQRRIALEQFHGRRTPPVGNPPPGAFSRAGEAVEALLGARGAGALSAPLRLGCRCPE